MLAAAFSPVAPLRACAGRRGEAGVARRATPEPRCECTGVRSCGRADVVPHEYGKMYVLVWTIMYAHDVRSGHEHVRGHHTGVPARPPRPPASPPASEEANYEGVLNWASSGPRLDARDDRQQLSPTGLVPVRPFRAWRMRAS